MNGYCEKHNQAYEIKCMSGQWVYECPKCRAEGLYDTYATTQTQMTPSETWVASNHTNIDNKYAIEVLEQQKLKLQGYADDYSLLWDAYDKAIDALWKKDSNVIGNIYHLSAKPNKTDDNHVYCGFCGKRIHLKTKPKFCCKCGARIEWEKKDVK